MSSYASPTDLALLGVAAGAISSYSTPQQQQALDTASAVADGYLRSRFTLPITTVSADLKLYVCWIAAYTLIASRGFNPEVGADQLVMKGYDDAIKWLRDVADERVTPALVDSAPSPGGTSPSAPLVLSNCKRDW